MQKPQNATVDFLSRCVSNFSVLINQQYDLEEHYPLKYFDEHDLKNDTGGTLALKTTCVL